MVRAILYWLLVVVVSLALVYALVRFFESRDESAVRSGVAVPAAQTALSAVVR